MGGKGSGGHNRKSKQQKLVEGNRGRRKINKREPEPPPVPPDAPSQTLTLLEQEFWNQIFPIVSKMQVMRQSDVFALGQLCRFLAEERECTLQLSKMGRLIPKKNDAGIVIGASLNPLARLRSDAARHVRSYLAVFGLGPSFRAALQGDDDPKPPHKTSFEQILSAKSDNDEVVN